jgi:hypothetical protein
VYRETSDITLYARWEKIFQLDTITVNGAVVVDSSGVFSYEIDCEDADSIPITLNLPAGVHSSIGDPFTVSTRFSSVLDTIDFTLSYGDEPEAPKTYQLQLKRPFDFDSIVHRQLGNRLLMVVNNPKNNGNHRFLEARWKIIDDDGNEIGWQNGNRFYYASQDGNPIFGTVTLSLRDSATKEWMTVCPDTLAPPDVPDAESTSVYPNPVAAGGVVHLRAAALPNGEDLSARYATFRLLDVQGALQRSGSASELQKGLRMPNLPGSYFLVLEGAAGKITLLVISY